MGGGRFRWTLAAAVLLLGVVMSWSRGAALALAVTLALMAVVRSRRREVAALRRAAAALTLGTVLVIAFVTAHDLWGMALRRVGVQDYDHDRVRAQRVALGDVGLRGWLLGIGPGQFEGRRFEGTQEYAAHSLYIRVLVENGAVTLVAFLVFVGLHLRLVPDPPAGGPAGTAAGVVLAITAGQLAYGLVIDALHWRHLWVLLGLAAWYRRR